MKFGLFAAAELERMTIMIKVAMQILRDGIRSSCVLSPLLCQRLVAQKGLSDDWILGSLLLLHALVQIGDGLRTRCALREIHVLPWIFPSVVELFTTVAVPNVLPPFSSEHVVI